MTLIQSEVEERAINNLLKSLVYFLVGQANHFIEVLLLVSSTKRQLLAQKIHLFLNPRIHMFQISLSRWSSYKRDWLKLEKKLPIAMMGLFYFSFIKLLKQNMFWKVQNKFQLNYQETSIRLMLIDLLIVKVGGQFHSKN